MGFPMRAGVSIHLGLRFWLFFCGGFYRDSGFSLSSTMLEGFVPKGTEEGDSEGSITRDAGSTRPLGLKNTPNKILTSVVIHGLGKATSKFIHFVQRGFIPGRNFGVNILELDTQA
eukprot:7745789-Pyramimonas_sp.AAC.1